MNYTSTLNLTSGRLAMLVIALLMFGTVLIANAQAPKTKGAKTFAPNEVVQQPLYSEYKGVRIGMTEQEVHAKLGQALKIDESDFYVFSDTETAQIAYDKNRKVTAISIDYAGGVGAPDYRAVVGNDIQTRPDGSLYKMVHYERLGFWVSYNRTGSAVPVPTVSITIQKILQ